MKNGIRQEAGPLGWISRTFQMKLSEIFVWNMFGIGTLLQASWASWDPKTSNFQSYFCQWAINCIHIAYDIYCLRKWCMKMLKCTNCVILQRKTVLRSLLDFAGFLGSKTHSVMSYIRKIAMKYSYLTFVMCISHERM